MNKSLFIAEGLLMYLKAEDIKSLLQQCAEISSSDSRFVFDHMNQRSDGRPDIGIFTSLTTQGLKLIGEPLLWSIQPRDLSHFVANTGWYNCPELIGTPKDYTVAGFAVLKNKT